jgi:hypothetical protein
MPSVPTSFNFDSDQVAEVGQTECNYASAPTCVGGAHRTHQIVVVKLLFVLSVASADALPD